MESDLEKSVRVLFELLREMWEQLGVFAGVAIGVILVVGIMLGFFAWRWLGRGGLRAGTPQRFFAQRREIERWFRSH